MGKRGGEKKEKRQVHTALSIREQASDVRLFSNPVPIALCELKEIEPSIRGTKKLR